MKHHSSLIAVVLFSLVFPMSLCAAQDAAEPPSDETVTVATVFGRPIAAEVVEPHALLKQRQMQHLVSADYATWLRKYRASRLTRLIVEPLRAAYTREHALEPTPAELAAATEAYTRRMGPDGGEQAQRSAETKASVVTTDWKFNKALYEQYGGVVVQRHFGPEALGAMRKWLESHEQAGDFKIDDPKLRADFWEYYLHVDQNLVVAAADPFGVPPWRDDPIDRLVQAVNVGPYEVPQLILKKDHNYAHSAVDVEPFRHVTPFKEHFLEQMEYTGPGRGIPEPEDLETVKIGFIGPIMSTVSVATGGKSHEETLGIPMLRGAQLALEQANAAGGYHARHIPFELVVSNDNGLWGASGNEIIKLAYKEQVWAILGTIDGANSHIAIRVALKAEIPMMNSGDTDPTFIETNIPWVFRCIGDDRQMSYLLVDYLYRKLNYTRIGIIRASNRYGRFGVREIKDGSRRLGSPVILEMAYKVGGEDYALQLQRLKAADVEAIVHWGDAVDGALILNEMRSIGMDQPYYCCDRCVSDEFIELAGENAEGVVGAYPWNPTQSTPELEAFRTAFRERYNTEPDTYAAHAYDGMNMLIWGIQVAGLNRAKIRDVLAHRPDSFVGVTGEIPLSACLDDLGEVFLARVEDGHWTFHSRSEWDVPRPNIAPRDRVSRKVAAQD